MPHKLQSCTSYKNNLLLIDNNQIEVVNLIEHTISYIASPTPTLLHILASISCIGVYSKNTDKVFQFSLMETNTIKNFIIFGNSTRGVETFVNNSFSSS